MSCILDKGSLFDLNKFESQFVELKNNQQDLQMFLQDYLNFEGSKSNQVFEKIKKKMSNYDYIFDKNFDMEDHFQPYILNIEKFESTYKIIDGKPSTILDGFCKNIRNNIEEKLNHLRQAGSYERERTSMILKSPIKTPLSRSPIKSKYQKNNRVNTSLNSSFNTSMRNNKENLLSLNSPINLAAKNKPKFSNTMRASGANYLLPKKLFAEMDLLEFKNASD